MTLALAINHNIDAVAAKRSRDADDARFLPLSDNEYAEH